MLKTKQEENSTPPLHEACLAAVVDALMNNPETDLNEADDNGNTLLHYVIRASNENKALQLMGCDKVTLNTQNKVGHTPLHWACMAVEAIGADVLKPLMRADCTALSENKDNALHIACLFGDDVAVKLLLTLGETFAPCLVQKNAGGRTPLEMVKLRHDLLKLKDQNELKEKLEVLKKAMKLEVAQHEVLVRVFSDEEVEVEEELEVCVQIAAMITNAIAATQPEKRPTPTPQEAHAEERPSKRQRLGMQS
jgi:hypothetical protein